MADASDRVLQIRCQISKLTNALHIPYLLFSLLQAAYCAQSSIVRLASIQTASQLFFHFAFQVEA
jgi:hypothetical protein